MARRPFRGWYQSLSWPHRSDWLPHFHEYMIPAVTPSWLGLFPSNTLPNYRIRPRLGPLEQDSDPLDSAHNPPPIRWVCHRRRSRRFAPIEAPDKIAVAQQGLADPPKLLFLRHHASTPQGSRLRWNLMKLWSILHKRGRCSFRNSNDRMVGAQLCVHDLERIRLIA